MAKREVKQDAKSVEQLEEKRLTCGIIMPIASSEGYTSAHWLEVKAIIEEASEAAGFSAKLVSEENEIGVIHNRIVQNIYENSIVVCDVSSKNPNVMFELGMRLAFDKATIVIKDDATNYSFDTSPIEHLNYPKSLKYSDINLFKLKLANKIRDTYHASLDEEYSTFLKHFVRYKRKLEEKEVDNADYILNKLDGISERLLNIEGKIPLRASVVAKPSAAWIRSNTLEDNVSNLVYTYLITTPEANRNFKFLWRYLIDNISFANEDEMDVARKTAINTYRKYRDVSEAKV